MKVGNLGRGAGFGGTWTTVTQGWATDVAIIGGGATALWLARELALQHGYRTLVIAENPLAEYASTRNQGWLHSGAYYLTDLHYSPAEALQCHEGEGIIRAFIQSKNAPQLVMQREGCYFLFPHDLTDGKRSVERAAAFEAACAASGVPAKQVSAQDVVGQEPLLHRSTVAGAIVRTEDGVVNTTGVLELVRDDARRAGAQFLPVRSLRRVGLEHESGGWVVRTPSTTVKCACVVIAAGTLIPWLWEAWRLGEARRFRISTLALLALNAPVSTAILVPVSNWAPVVVPFQGDFHRGSLICLQGKYRRREIRDVSQSLSPASVHDLEDELAISYPSIRRECPEAGIPGYVYAGLGLTLRNQLHIGNILVSHARELERLPGIFTSYAFKFTTAPVAAVAASNEISAYIGAGVKALRGSRSGLPVAKQPFHRRANCRLIADGGRPKIRLPRGRVAG